MDSRRITTYAQIVKVAIIVSWITLIGFWIIKLLGGEYFAIVVEKATFIKFANWLDASWGKYLVSFITVFVAKFLQIGATTQNLYYKGKELIFVVLSIISIWAVSTWVDFISMNFWYGFLVVILFGVIKNKGWKKSLGLLTIVADFVFSTLTMLTRGVELQVEAYQSALPSLIICIDLYIMYLLYYLYANLINMKKGEKKNVILDR